MIHILSKVHGSRCAETSRFCTVHASDVFSSNNHWSRISKMFVNVNNVNLDDFWTVHTVYNKLIPDFHKDL